MGCFFGMSECDCRDCRGDIRFPKPPAETINETTDETAEQGVQGGESVASVPLECKSCIGCHQDKPRSEFWSACKGTTRLVSRCKTCHIQNRRRYKYNRKSRDRKPRGFEALAEDIKADVLKMLGDGAKKKAIATKHRIPYTTFCQWCQKGWVR